MKPITLIEHLTYDDDDPVTACSWVVDGHLTIEQAVDLASRYCAKHDYRSIVMLGPPNALFCYLNPTGTDDEPDNMSLTFTHTELLSPEEFSG